MIRDLTGQTGYKLLSFIFRGASGIVSSEKRESAAEGVCDASASQIVNVVDKYEPMGLIPNGEDVLPEQHLVFPDEFEDDSTV